MIPYLAVAVASGVLVIGACVDGESGLVSRPGIAAPQLDCGIDCFCCGGEDPNPSAPGIWFGGITPSECFASQGSTGVDADDDGLEDYCEEVIAPAFAPELHYYSGGDDVRGEPHWAARPDSSSHMIIAYLLSYYRDLGTYPFLTACQIPPPDYFVTACWGHFGDSEIILLTVYYNSSTQHWVLSRAVYSQHEDFGTYDKGSNAYPTQLTYPDHPGTYPRAWVAEGKHGNYASQSECDAGGTFDSDTCDEVDASARVVTYASSGSLNIGSSAQHTSSQDCMQSANPSYEWYGGGRVECYWSTPGGYRFRGWIPDSVAPPRWYKTDDSDPYGPKLLSWGF